MGMYVLYSGTLLPRISHTIANHIPNLVECCFI